LTSELHHLVEACETDLGAQLHGLGPKTSIQCVTPGIRAHSPFVEKL
jgi:hypothetical protein